VGAGLTLGELQLTQRWIRILARLQAKISSDSSTEPASLPSSVVIFNFISHALLLGGEAGRSRPREQLSVPEPLPLGNPLNLTPGFGASFGSGFFHRIAAPRSSRP